MILPLIALFGSILGSALPCAAQTLPRLGLSGPEVGMDLSARPLRGSRIGQPGADAVIRQPKGAGRSRTLARGEPEAIARSGTAPEEDEPAAVAGEGGWSVDLRGWASPPRSARAEP